MTRKRNGISWWMVALNGVILTILAFKTWACLADPSLLFGQAVAYDPAHVGALRELAGRNLAMIALGLLAWLRPSPAADLSVFAVAFVRETSDMGIAAFGGGPPLQAASFLPFLLVYLLAISRLVVFERSSGVDDDRP